MTPQELRIGNIVQHPNRGKDGYTYINSRDIQNIEEGTEYGKLFQPIQLTEGWLLKFGFSMGGSESMSAYYHKTQNHVNVCVRIYRDAAGGFGYCRGNNEYMECNTQAVIYWHVHQLQNLFYCLTGTELTTTKG